MLRLFVSPSPPFIFNESPPTYLIRLSDEEDGILWTYLAKALREDEVVGDVHPVEHVEDNLQEGEEADQVEDRHCHRLVRQQ